MLQGSYFTFQQARGLHRYDAPAGVSCFASTAIGFLTSAEILFWTLAPCACVTYYQAQGLSGHTSPCGECVCFLTPTPLMIKDATLQDALTFLFRNTVGTHHRRKIFFFLLKSTIHSSDNLFLRRQRWSKMSITQASLFGEG